MAGTLLLTLGAGFPCLWDSDTLDDELRGLPDAFRLVVGRWPRHGAAYYEARIVKLGTRESLTLAEFDDLTVAYEFLERREEAIATLARKATALARTPDRDHEYRYHANLGTVYAHLGRYEDALVELEKAIAIEPNAHFGRERFQIEAIRYVAAAKREPRLWEEQDFLSYSGWGWRYLFRWVSRADEREIATDVNRKLVEFRPAFEGIGGMLRFGGRDSAELFRTLGNVFADHGDLNLAWWSWQRALERGHPATTALHEAISAVEDHWAAVNQQPNVPSVIAPTRADYEAARRNADAWVAAFQRREARAIAEGVDPTKEDALRSWIAESDREVPAFVPRSWSVLSWVRKNPLLSTCYGLAIAAWLVSLARRKQADRRFSAQRRRARTSSAATPRLPDPPPTR